MRRNVALRSNASLRKGESGSSNSFSHEETTSSKSFPSRMFRRAFKKGEEEEVEEEEEEVEEEVY